MVFIMIISFTIAWTPYSLFALMEQFATEGIVSPGAGVIPALVAKSSICYDPLIYVGMNSQFRQSIKRIFGIHTKRGGSQTDKCYNNTLLSPAHRQSAYNDITVRYNSETIMSSTQRKRDRNNITEDSDNHSISMTINEVGKLPGKSYDLCTIQETKTASDAERSGDTICDEDSCGSNKKFELVFGESCKSMQEPSPIVTMVDSQRFLFTRTANTNASNSSASVHSGDKALIDFNEVKGTKRPIKHSYSLDLGGITMEGRKRKFSIETKLESFSPSKIFSKDRVVCKLFESDSRHDGVKSFLCRFDKTNSEDDNL
ncbi:jg22606 [Pararge aegeria aegeria]|uniref:Jg22606 protein n=1 Tax=Pararge aegeria aegeria TaxID=348720 RepID=A0A8S4SN12_9NEOP|nr:jg22606 [Pararge aegeria aegeria]